LGRGTKFFALKGIFSVQKQHKALTSMEENILKQHRKMIFPSGAVLL
jgi:hypothetical protein